MTTQLSFLTPDRVPPAPPVDDTLLLLLRQEAYGLMTALFGAMLGNPGDARLVRLRGLHWRAEGRYWRRWENENPPGNRTPDWLVKTSNAGY